MLFRERTNLLKNLHTCIVSSSQVCSWYFLQHCLQGVRELSTWYISTNSRRDIVFVLPSQHIHFTTSCH